MDVIVPWASGERTNTTWAIPASLRSSVYLPAPVSSVGSSSRCTALPRIEPAVAIASPPMPEPTRTVAAGLYCRRPTTEVAVDFDATQRYYTDTDTAMATTAATSARPDDSPPTPQGHAAHTDHVRGRRRVPALPERHPTRSRSRAQNDSTEYR